MKSKHTDDQLERRIRELCAEKAPQPEIVDQKMEEAYHTIREMPTDEKRKRPVALKFSAAAAVLALVMVYCLKNPAIAAQIPVIGNIFRSLEGRVSFPGDYSRKSIKLDAAAADPANNREPDQTDGKADRLQSDPEYGKTTAVPPGNDEANNIPSGNDKTNNIPSGNDKTNTVPSGQENDIADQTGNTGQFQSEVNGVTVTLSEAAYDHQAIYLALCIQTKEAFSKDALYPDQLCYDAQVKLYKEDGSSDEYTYESEGLFVRAIEGEFVDSHTFKGLFEFSEPDFNLPDYTFCELTFSEFEQQLTTGETEVIVVPDYGEVSRTIPDSTHYRGPWKFCLDFDSVELEEQERTVHDVNDQGFGIEKIVKTAYEIYAVPILPEGIHSDGYVATIWDADGQPLENRNFGKYLSMSYYDRDVSEVTVYLLKTEDFLNNKGNHADKQPEKAIYQTTVRLDESFVPSQPEE